MWVLLASAGRRLGKMRVVCARGPTVPLSFIPREALFGTLGLQIVCQHRAVAFSKSPVKPCLIDFTPAYYEKCQKRGQVKNRSILSLSFDREIACF